MKKLTKRFKNNKFNRTFKKGGGTSQTISTPQNSIPQSDTNETNDTTNDDTIRKNGVIGYLGNTVKSGIGKIVEIGEDAGLRAFGLERINESENNDNENDSNDSVNESSGLVSNISGNLQNVANKTGAAIIENVNEVLGSDAVKENIQKATENTVSIIKDNLKIVNNTLNEPEFKEEFINTTNRAAEYGNLAIEAAKGPINKAAEVGAQAASKAIAATSSGAVKVITDFMGAIPGVGAVIDTLKAVNDGSKAVSGVIEATSDAIEAGTNLITETKENFKKGVEIFEKNKKLAEQISNRTNQTINDFENPLNRFENTTAQAAGSHKTRRRLFKRKSKSKRVRFAF